MPVMIVVGSADELKEGKGHLAMTFTQAAARLGVTEMTLRKYVKDGRINPYPERYMSSLLFVEQDVEHLKASMMNDRI